MKKLIALSVVLMVLAGTGFAEVAVTGQVDATVMPLQVSAPDEGDALIGAGVGRNGSGDAPRARIGITATNDTEQVGINFKVQFNPNQGTAKLGIDDFAEVWWKPIPQLKIEAGKFVNDTLRGKIGDDNWHRYTVNMKDADGIFSRFKTTWRGDISDAGFMLGISPIEPLFIGVSVPSVVQITPGGPDTVKGTYTYTEQGKTESKTVGNVAKTYEKIQVGAGFTIENIGLARLQYVGASYDRDIEWYTEDTTSNSITGLKAVWWTNPLNVRRIEAAFAFTGMKGLVVDVGVKIPFGFKTYEYTDTTVGIIRVTDDDFTYQAPFQVSLGAGFTADALDIKGRVDAQFLGGAKHDDEGEYKIGPNINIHLWPSYNLGFATAGLDVGFNFIGDSEIEGGGSTETFKGGYQFGIGAWLKKAYGGASIKGGLALSLGENNDKKLNTVFSVPIIFDYTF